MIVFDLKCAGGGHVFEGWFGSSADYEDQRGRGLLACPVCGDGDVGKAAMAPAVAAKGNQRSDAGPTVPVQAGGDIDARKAHALMRALAKAQAEALKTSEWVGGDFADRARAMHYGEEDTRAIHGQVDAGEARGLIEEGVEVAPLIFPVIPPEAQN